MRDTFVKTILIVGLVIGLAIPGSAVEDKSAEKSVKESKDSKDVKAEKSEQGDKAEKKERMEEHNILRITAKSITGQVSAISKDYIAILYQTDKNQEYEMGIYIEGIPKLERVKDLTQIQAGDTVTVEYDVATEEGEDDKEFARHIAQKIIFVKKAPPPPPETDALISVETKE